MRPFIRLLGISFVALSLSACETAAPDEKVEVAQPMSEVQMEQTYNDIIHNTGDGSVQVFPLEDQPPAAYNNAPEVYDPLLPVGSNLPQGAGRPFGGDANVMVFPLDDQAIPSYAGRGEIPPMIEPTPLTPAPYDQSLMNDANRIYFNHGQTSVSAEGQKVTSAIADQCRAGGCGIVKIDGHASTRAVAKDEVQRRLINLKVSMERAINVSRQLIRQGIPADAIQLTAHGDRVPPSVSPGTDIEAASRRVEIMAGGYAPSLY